jgi:xylan 1,4-beta-xylosidase
MGRNTIIEPIEWTKDGWCKTSVKDLNYKIIQNNIIEPDDFSGNKLKLQWSFSGLNDLKEYQLVNGTLKLNGTKDKMRVLQAVTGDYSYEASIKLAAETNTETGLLLYYNQTVFAGIAINNGKVFSYSKGKKHWGSEINAPECKYLKIKMDSYTLTMFYSSDGIKWEPYEVGLDLSGYHTNILNGFSSLKLGIYCKGEGSVIIDDFKYKVLD